MKLAKLPPYCELTTADLIQQTLKFQCVGLTLLVFHIILSKLSTVAFFPVVLLAIGWLYHKAPLGGLLVFFQWLIYQNWVLAILSVGMDYSTFTMLQGSSFAVLVLLAGISLTRLTTSKRWRHLNGRLLAMVKLALILAAVYALYGMTKVGFTPAAVYFRASTALVLAVPIGLDVGRVWGYKTVGAGFLASATLSIAITLVEIAAPAPYYDLINAPNYENMNYSKAESSVKDGPQGATLVLNGRDLAEANRSVLFNVTGSESNDKSFRFLGTALHPISTGYILAACALVAVSIGMGQWLWLVVPLLVMIGVKGANLLFACSMLLWWGWYITRSRRFLLISGFIMMAAYIQFGLSFGLERGDMHVIGFMGGVRGFLANPLGRGLGVGGNFSPLGNQHVRWDLFQRVGADFALESAVGVLIFQMGVAAIAIFAVIAYLLKQAPFGVKGPQRRDIIFIALATVTVNGIFQEEAYTTYACGLFTLLCAVTVANGYRTAATYTPRYRRVLGYPPPYRMAG
jgi:hypothetical protein